MSGSELNFFADEEEVLHIVKNICSSFPREDDRRIHTNISQNFDRLTLLLCKYLEQPSLLNGSMTAIMTHLCEALLRLSLSIQQRSGSSNEISTPSSSSSSFASTSDNEPMSNFYVTQFLLICECIQLLCRVRGFKHVLKHFPHEVSHLELCVGMIQNKVHHKNDTLYEISIQFIWTYLI